MVKPRAAQRDQVEDGGAEDCPEALGYDIPDGVLRRHFPCGKNPDGDRRIDVTTRDPADGIGHRDNREAKGDCNPQQPYTARSDSDVPAITAEPQPKRTRLNVPMNSAPYFFMVFLLFNRPRKLPPLINLD